MAAPQFQARRARHVLVLVFDGDMELVAYEAQKDGVVRAREGLSAMTVGGPDAPPQKHDQVPMHPGPAHPPGDNENDNPVHLDVRKGSDRKRAHMTFRVTGNDPCMQVGDDLICWPG